MNDIKTAYSSSLAKDYDEKRFTTKQGKLLDKLEKRELERIVDWLSSDAKILEVGTGTGRFTVDLAKKGFNIIGLDPSPYMLEKAKEKVKNYNNTQLQIGEGKTLNFNNGIFDLVYSIRVLNHVESKEYAYTTVSEMIRVTKPGGYILIEFANRERPFQRNIYPNKIRFSFKELIEFTKNHNTEVISKRGVFAFSMGFIENNLPSFLVPIWEILEIITSMVFWKQCSRGYLILRKSYR